MPVKVTAYACQFKCGRKVTTKRKDMEHHEKSVCRLNPDVRACPTCIHEVLDFEDDGEMLRGCCHDKLPTVYTEPDEWGRDNLYWNKAKTLVMRRHCEQWAECVEKRGKRADEY